MFSKRLKKKFPPGTFIPMPARVCAIIQLCLAFTVILWNASLPFAGDLFNVKSKLLVYQEVMGISGVDTLSQEKLDRLQRNAERFQQLPEYEKNELQLGLASVQKELKRSFPDKLKQSLHILFIDIPTFEQAWILLSLILPILLLKRVDGAAQAIWLLPLLAAAYSFDNRRYATPPSASAEARLFPTEQVLIEDYLNSSLSPDIFEQHQQLKRAWNLYLVSRWAKEIPSKDPLTLTQQIEAGEFAFNLERLNLQRANTSSKVHPFTQEPLSVLAFYLFWNIFFALTARKALASERWSNS